MYYTDQKQTNYNYGAALNGGSLSGRSIEEQEKWQAHIAMEQQAKMSQTAPHPQSSLESAINSVAGGIDDAFSALGLLANRLQLVLQPEMPQPLNNAACGADCAPRSEAVARLHGLRSQLEALTARINATNGRLDT